MTAMQQWGPCGQALQNSALESCQPLCSGDGARHRAIVSGTQAIHSGFEDGKCAWTEGEEGMNEVWSHVPWERGYEQVVRRLPSLWSKAGKEASAAISPPILQRKLPPTLTRTL